MTGATDRLLCLPRLCSCGCHSQHCHSIRRAGALAGGGSLRRQLGGRRRWHVGRRRSRWPAQQPALPSRLLWLTQRHDGWAASNGCKQPLVPAAAAATGAACGHAATVWHAGIWARPDAAGSRVPVVTALTSEARAAVCGSLCLPAPRVARRPAACRSASPAPNPHSGCSLHWCSRPGRRRQWYRRQRQHAAASRCGPCRRHLRHSTGRGGSGFG